MTGGGVALIQIGFIFSTDKERVRDSDDGEARDDERDARPPRRGQPRLEHQPGTQLNTLKNPHENTHENRHEPKFEKETCANFLFHEFFSIRF